MLSLKLYLILATTKHQLPYYKYKHLAEWLGCYSYIFPASRTLKIVPTFKVTTPVDYIRLQNLADIYYSTLTPQEQLQLAYSPIGKNYVCVISP